MYQNVLYKVDGISLSSSNFSWYYVGIQSSLYGFICPSVIFITLNQIFQVPYWQTTAYIAIKQRSHNNQVHFWKKLHSVKIFFAIGYYFQGEQMSFLPSGSDGDLNYTSCLYYQGKWSNDLLEIMQVCIKETRKLGKRNGANGLSIVNRS
jgi:phosphotransferase system  glucose/maltose/N-acetylglucosamine-specific IIC component